MVKGNALALVAMAAVAALLAACSSSGTPPPKEYPKEFFSEAIYGKASPRVVQAGEPVPRGGGRAVIGEPYRVAGKTYIPREDPSYTASGLASWYGAAFHGRKTANGEIYDMEGLTAAHPTLPLPSYARVTNAANGKSIMVRVNDRGPFHRNRVIDVSQKVAEILDFKRAGTARVHVEYIGPAQMDGLDHSMLLASYREGGRDIFGSTRALMASVIPQPRLRPIEVGSGQVHPAVKNPAAQVPMADDPLAPLIMRTSFANSYAEVPDATAAARAAGALARSELGESELETALGRAAEEKARQLGVIPGLRPVVVQLATFADPDNADRTAREFSRFGETQRRIVTKGDKVLTIVMVVVDPVHDPHAVIAVAARSGLNGAFVTR